MRFKLDFLMVASLCLASCTSLKGGSAEDDGGMTGGSGGMGGSSGSGGSGGEDPSPCEIADCDDYAACSVVDDVALCECLSPYVGEGDSCVLDVQCEMLACGDSATCVGAGGARSCQCVADFMLVGDVCERIDDCDPNPCERGECVDLVGDYQCECPGGWAGKDCEDDDCTTTTCEEGQSCITGPTCVPTCAVDDSCGVGEACIEPADCGAGACTGGVCHPGCASTCGDEQVCVADDDCASGFCSRDTAGTPTGLCRPACARAGCGTNETCTRTEDCEEGSCTGDVCHPGCGTSCQPGDTCATSANCAGPDTCHATDHVCLASCSGHRELATSAELEDAYYCHTITGDLTINPSAGVTTIGPDRLPYLERVGGFLRLSAGLAVTSFTLPELTEIGAYFASAQNMVGEISLPKLVTIGTFGVPDNTLEIVLATTNVIDMPLLETVYGHVNIGNSPGLATIDLGSLSFIENGLSLVGADDDVMTLDLSSLDSRSDISGDIWLDGLPRIRWDSLHFMDSARTRDIVNEVGCDTASPCNCNGSTSCFP